MIRLHPADVDAIARRVAELVREEASASQLRFLTAAQVAKRFNVTRDWVYAHADDLGAIRLGEGPRARFRFDPTQTIAAMASRSDGERSDASGPAPRRARRRQASPAQSDGCPLLP